MVIADLENPNIDIKIKKQKLKDFYAFPSIEVNIQNFLDKTDVLLKKMNIGSSLTKDVLYDFYNLYCCHKHNNFISFVEGSEFVSAKVACILSLISYYKEKGEISMLKNIMEQY